MSKRHDYDLAQLWQRLRFELSHGFDHTLTLEQGGFTSKDVTDLLHEIYYERLLRILVIL